MIRRRRKLFGQISNRRHYDCWTRMTLLFWMLEIILKVGAQLTCSMVFVLLSTNQTNSRNNVSPTGYRYELYCASKSARTTQCTIFCGITKDKGWEFNLTKTAADDIDVTLNNAVDNSEIPYTREIFDALCLRYEEPQANNRWDSPLFTIIPDGSFDFNDVYAVLFEKKPPPPNLSTQNVSGNDLTGIILNSVFCSQKTLSLSSALGTYTSLHESHSGNEIHPSVCCYAHLKTWQPQSYK